MTKLQNLFFYNVVKHNLMSPEQSVTPTRMDVIQAVAPAPSWKYGLSSTRNIPKV